MPTTLSLASVAILLVGGLIAARAWLARILTTVLVAGAASWFAFHAGGAVARGKADPLTPAGAEAILSKAPGEDAQALRHQVESWLWSVLPPAR